MSLGLFQNRKPPEINNFRQNGVEDEHDNRIDKISWNEQWQGWPVGPEYAASSNVDHASTLQVVNPLIKAQK